MDPPRNGYSCLLLHISGVRKIAKRIASRENWRPEDRKTRVHPFVSQYYVTRDVVLRYGRIPLVSFVFVRCTTCPTEMLLVMSGLAGWVVVRVVDFRQRAGQTPTSRSALRALRMRIAERKEKGHTERRKLESDTCTKATPPRDQ